ncbi:MAG: toxin-antitoxin system HicB family antitoxin [Castellaniella sp.]
MSKFDPSRYTVEIKRISTPEDEVYEAKVKEIPGVSAYAKSPANAFDEARDALEALHELSQEQGLDFPKPLPAINPRHSGRVTLRMSRTLHYQAALIAEYEGVSLNALITEALFERVFGNRTNDGTPITLSAKALVHERSRLQKYRGCKDNVSCG